MLHQSSAIDEIIPATLQSSLVARLDRLDSAKETAQTAAVIGREFPYDLLRNVVDCDEEQLRADLDHLVVSDLVNRQGRPPTAIYSFKHALVQDAAYATILKSKRQRLHAKIVSALEVQTGGNAIERVDTLAYHAGQAELWEQAFSYLSQAGGKAMDRAGLREAAAQFENALKLADKLQPENYLEIGVRTGGSLIPLVHNCAVKEVIAVDLWAGSYSGVYNTAEYTESQHDPDIKHGIVNGKGSDDAKDQNGWQQIGPGNKHESRYFSHRTHHD